MTPLAVTLILCVGTASTVSVDPDLEELPMQAETEDVFVFPSMRMNPLSLDVKVNYRGMPPQKVQELTAFSGPQETERRGGEQTPVTRRTGQLQGFTLKPGAGSWNFNSIEDTARKGLAPTHVPNTFSDAPSDLLPESSETVYSTPSTQSEPSDCRATVRGCSRAHIPDSHHHEKPTIPPFYKQILKNSNDYQHWLKLKHNFLREQKMLFAKTNLQTEQQPLGNVPRNTGSSVESGSDDDNNDKFPHFPDKIHTVVESNGVGKDIRPQREIKVNLHSAPPVYKEGGTLYRAPTSRPQPVQQPTETTTTKRRASPVQVSSLRTTPYPGATYSSPLYPKYAGSRAPFFTTPQPPLPPGYELVPVDQLTDDHEVVPWEDLPHLMKKHNLSLNRIPLGPFQHPTPTPYQTPYTSYTTPYKQSPPTYSKHSPKPKNNYGPTPTPNYSTTRKPFTAFTTPGLSYSPTPKYGKSHVKYYPERGEGHKISPFMLPPVSPDISHSLFQSQEAHVGFHSPKRRPSVTTLTPKYKSKTQTVKPKSIHFGTNFANKPKKAPVKPLSSATYSYNPTTAPTQENHDHTPSLVSRTTKHPFSTLPTLGRFSPNPFIYSTTAVPFFESTKIPKSTLYPRPVKSQLSTTIRYTTSGPTLRYSQKPTQAAIHNYHSPTTVQNNYRIPTTATYLNMRYNVPNPSPVPKKKEFPPPMPKFLPPPNNPLPTYFDVSTPVPPTPPRAFPSPRPVQQHSAQTFRPKIPNAITPVPIFHVPTQKKFSDPSRSHPTPHSFPKHPLNAQTKPPPIVLQGRLNTQGNSGNPPHVVFPSNAIKPQETPRVKFTPTLKPANFNKPKQQALVTKAVAVFHPDVAVPQINSIHEQSISSGLDRNKGNFEHFTEKTGSTNQKGRNPNTNGHLRSEEPKFGKESLFTAPKPDKRLVALTTLRPDLATKHNRNKMRSSTHKNKGKKKIGRLNVRLHKQPPAKKFHPIQPRPDGESTLLPQARPNVPVSETDHTGGIRPKIPLLLADNARETHHQSKEQTTQAALTDRSVLSNNNNGIWFIEEKMKDFDNDRPLKREFSETNNRTTINPAITERPRTWPASLKTSAPKQNGIYDDVTVIERSKNGEREKKFTGKKIESTTFSTSRVQVSMSTTPSPNFVKGGNSKDLMKLIKQKRLNNLENNSNSALKDLMLGKGKKLLDALQGNTDFNDENVIVNNRGESPNSINLSPVASEKDNGVLANDVSRADVLKNTKLGRLRRKKLRQRAKALATAIEDMEKEEPYIVFPMDKRNTENKNVDEIFDHKNHPGLKRISAYDFEAMERAREEAEQSISKPVAELKISIEDLANTMSILTKSVTETTTKKDTDSDDKISQLQEEIAKLTRTLENLKLAPSIMSLNNDDKSLSSPSDVHSIRPKENELLRPASSHISHARDKIDLGADTTTNQKDSEESGSTNIQKTWLSKGNWEIVDRDEERDEVIKKPEKLEIIEVYTLPTKQSTNSMKRWRTTPAPRATRKTTVQAKLESSLTHFSTPEPEQKWFIKPSMSSNKVFENSRVSSFQEIHETTTKKHPTNDNDISKFFGSTKEKDFGLQNVPSLTAKQDANEFFQPQNIKPQPNDAHFINHGNLKDINSNEPHVGGVLGLFEMMGKINKEATNNFDVIKLPTKEDNRNQELRFQEIQDKMRLEQIAKLKAEEEELRAQQREKLKLFQMLQQQEDEETKKQQEKDSKLNSFDDLQGWTNEKTWEQTLTQDKGQAEASNEKPGTAFASITIENVDVNDARDYEVSNGIVKLKKDNTAFENDVSDEYEYEYYVADPDDIQFPVGGTRQFYETQTEKAAANVNQLSNKDLLLNLLQASNNFQNQEFLDRLKSIVTGTDGANTLESLSVEDQNYIQNNLMKQNNRFGQGSVSLLNNNNLKGLGGESSTRSVLRSFDGDSWAPTSNQLTPKPTKLINNLNNLPIWPSSNSFKPPKDELPLPTSNNFEPVSNPIRFPNRRMDSGFGVGEISLVTGNERKKVTSLSGFQTAPVSSKNSYMSDSRISDKLDTTSDQEFVVGTSLSMNQASPQHSNFRKYKFDSTEHSNANIGYATPIPTILNDNNNYRTGTATPVKSNGYKNSRPGSEVFRLGNGIQIQQPGHMGQTTASNNQNYILPTFTNEHPFQYGRPANRNTGEIYSDIRVESGKKNLLTLPTDPNSLYIKSTQDTPEAEVIVYPMGQLLTNSNHKQITSPDQMIMSGSAENAMTQDLPARTRDQIPVYHLSQDLSEKLNSDTELYDPRQEVNKGTDTKPPPKGILQTLIRSAKDDLDFAGNVINFLTRS